MNDKLDEQLLGRDLKSSCLDIGLGRQLKPPATTHVDVDMTGREFQSKDDDKDISEVTILSATVSSSSISLDALAIGREDDLEPMIVFAHKHLPKALGRLRDRIFVKAEGSLVWDDEGRQVLDFTCGLGVTNLGQ